MGSSIIDAVALNRWISIPYKPTIVQPEHNQSSIDWIFSHCPMKGVAIAASTIMLDRPPP